MYSSDSESECSSECPSECPSDNESERYEILSRYVSFKLLEVTMFLLTLFTTVVQKTMVVQETAGRLMHKS